MRVRVVVSACLFALLAAAGAQARDDAKAAAGDAAVSWLALLDHGEWSTSWTEASRLFQGAVTRDTWRRQIEAVRAPLGALESRELISATYTESLPGAPDGRYVVIQYRARFAHKAHAIETITPAYESGRWRVSGYYVR